MTSAITSFFAKTLGAPLKNSLWSWGAETDEAVYLRCWQHERVSLEGKTWGVHVDGYSGYAGITDNLGLNERRQHIETIKAGKPAFVVMCIGDPKAEPGADTIKKYNDREVFIGGTVRTLEDGKIVLEITGRKPVTVAAGQPLRS